MEVEKPKDHEKLFNEICHKLNELSQIDSKANAESLLQTNAIQSELKSEEKYKEKIEKMQAQLKKSQDELRQVQFDVQEKIMSMESLSFTNNDLHREVKRLTEQLEQERINNSKISTDLAKSLEMNLRLQFEIEEIRTKANQSLNEEKKHNSFLIEKNKTLTHELDLSQAIGNEARLELAKAKDKFLLEQNQWAQDKKTLDQLCEDQKASIEEKQLLIEKMQNDIQSKRDEIQKISDSINEFENHSSQQQELMKNLSEVAEKKLIELKLALDKKTIECQDYYSHLQQALTQINIFRQENTALKDYISKLAQLHQSQQQQRAQLQS